MINRDQIIREFDSFPNLKTYLTCVSSKDFQKKIIDKDIKDILEKPIIFKWIKKSTTKEYLLVIDKKVGKLLRLKQKGKIKNWLWGDDQQFNSMTAERYIADYLEAKLKLTNIYRYEDNLQTKGVDGFISKNSEMIGVEVTTLNGFLAEWMLIDRLTWLLEVNNIQLLNKGCLKIYYSGKKLMEFRKYIVQETQEYIKKAFSSINDHQEKEKWYPKHLNIRFKVDKNGSPGYIVWEQIDNKFPSLTGKFLEDITTGVIETIEEKERQLKNQSANIVFIGINHAGCLSWLNPGIFEELGNRKPAISYNQQINMLEDFYASSLPENILGVVFFVYSLPQEVPFYPLFLLRNSKTNHNQYEELYELLFKTTKE